MSKNLQGVIWSLAATALFATVAAMAKIAVTEYHVLQILLFRQVIVFISTVPSVKKSFPQSLKTDFPFLHALRLIGAFIALSCGIWAVAVLPLTTAVTLGFAQVFIVALIALFFLNEEVGIHRISAVIAGFVGVVIVMRPGIDGLADLNALIPIAAATGAAIALTSVRKLSQTESTSTLLVYQSIFVGLMAGVPLFWLWKTPSLPDFGFLIAMGILATVGQWVGVKALRLAEASIIGNTKYVELVYAAAFGYFLFGEVPDSYTILGASIIICSSVYILHRDAVRKVHAVA